MGPTYLVRDRSEVDAIDPDGDRDVWCLRFAPPEDAEKWHSGSGWYLQLDEYPDEGVVGAFSTTDEALDWVRRSGGILWDHREHLTTVRAEAKLS